MSVSRPVTEMRLVNGSTGDPVLFIDYPGKNDAFLFDAGELCGISLERLADLEAVFLTHFHIDHFVGFDRILREPGPGQDPPHHWTGWDDRSDLHPNQELRDPALPFSKAGAPTDRSTGRTPARQPWSA